jgi:hypothetical protein
VRAQAEASVRAADIDTRAAAVEVCLEPPPRRFHRLQIEAASVDPAIGDAGIDGRAGVCRDFQVDAAVGAREPHATLRDGRQVNLEPAVGRTCVERPAHTAGPDTAVGRRQFRAAARASQLDPAVGGLQIDVDAGGKLHGISHAHVARTVEETAAAIGPGVDADTVRGRILFDLDPLERLLGHLDGGGAGCLLGYHFDRAARGGLHVDLPVDVP